MNTAQVINQTSPLVNEIENIDIQVLTRIITSNINNWLNKKPTNSKRNLTIITGLARNSVNQLSRGLGSIVNMHPSKINPCPRNDRRINKPTSIEKIMKKKLKIPFKTFSIQACDKHPG